VATDLSLLPVVEEGRQAGQAGAPLQDCPYSAVTDGVKVLSWLGGHRYGRTAEGAGPAPAWDTAVEIKVWEPNRHPRDKHGRFIRIGDLVNLPGGGQGKVTGITDAGQIEVHRTDGRHVTVDAHAASASKPGDGSPAAPRGVTPLGAEATAAAERFVRGLGGPLDPKRLDNYNALDYKETTLDPHWKYTNEQRDAIHAYTASTAYREVNGRLRNGDASSPEVAVMDSAMQGLPENIELHKAVPADIGNQLIGLSPGSVIEDPAYSSTSLLEGNYILAAGRQSMQLHIIAPKGTMAAWASPVADDYSEYEMLLQRNQRFAVLKSTPAGPGGQPPGRVWLLAVPTDKGSP
jgi:ribosome modulation factor